MKKGKITYCFVYETMIGKISIGNDGEAITFIHLGDELKGEYEKRRTELSDRAVLELEEYFSGNRQDFDIPLRPCGTEFQRQVWNQLCQIPYGETRSYKQIAEMIENPKACRAVGMANNRNPIIIMIPCHRVIGSNGKLVGYACGLEVKKRFLELEKQSLFHVPLVPPSYYS